MINSTELAIYAIVLDIYCYREHKAKAHSFDGDGFDYMDFGYMKGRIGWMNR